MDIIIETERLLIKNLTLNEIEVFNKRNIGKYDNNEFSIYLKDSNKKIGAIGFSFKDEKKVELRYGIMSLYQGKGYMTETLKYFIDYLFSQNINKIVIICKIDNNSSNKVALKAGFRLLKTFNYQDFGECNYYELNSKKR